jgi:hypothetical protein
MEAVRTIIENSGDTLTIHLPKEYENRKLEVIVLALDEVSVSKKKYDFSDYIGKLQWKGDALNEQKRLRDEWE